MKIYILRKKKKKSQHFRIPAITYFQFDPSWRLLLDNGIFLTWGIGL